MNKERLEEIRKRLVLLHSAVDVDDEAKNYIFKDLKVEWLVEQVQELEKDIKEWEIVNESWEEINTVLVRQNKRYREAIHKGINATRYTNSEVAYMLNEALEESN